MTHDITNILELNQCLSDVILERLSISDEVSNTSASILKTIEENKREANKQSNTVEEGVKVFPLYCRYETIIKRYDGKSGEDKHYNVRFLVGCKCYNFLSKEDFLRLSEKYESRLNTASSSFDNTLKVATLFIPVVLISGQIYNPTTMDNIQHEVQHMVQEFRKQKPIPSNPNLYVRAMQYLSAKDELTRAIAHILYYSDSSEQDGYVNGLYRQLKSTDRLVDILELIETPTIIGLHNLRNAIAYIEDTGDSTVSSTLKTTFKASISKNKLLSFAKAGERRFLGKIGKVLARHREEILNKPTYIKENIGDAITLF